MVAESELQLTVQDRLGQRAPFRAAWVAQGLISPHALPALIARGVAEHPATRMIFHVEGELEYFDIGDLWRRAAPIAQALRRRGLLPGDRVAVQMPLWPEHVLAFLACLQAGLVYIPLLTIFGPAETDFVLREAAVRCLIVPGKFRSADFAARLASLEHRPALSIVARSAEIPPGAEAFATLAADAETGLPAATQPDDVCAIVYTSGTTSQPKGALHTHSSLHAITRISEHFSPPDRDSANLASLPGISAVMYMLRPFLCDEAAIYVDHWSAEVAARLVGEFSPWWSGGTPFHLATILDITKGATSIRHFITGGANVPPAIVRRAEAMGVKACRSYGSTEQPMISATLDEDDVAFRAETDGRPNPGCHVRMRDEQGNLVGIGEAGEIEIMGPQLFAGYLAPELNKEAFTGDGWFRTGDIGVLDANGRLRIVDRKKDIIIRGGYNISSKEVEDIMATHPAVAEAAAVSFPDAALGEKIGVFVRPLPGLAPSLADIAAHFASCGVARHKTPEYLVLVEDFPRNPGGKIIKTTLRQRAREILGG